MHASPSSSAPFARTDPHTRSTGARTIKADVRFRLYAFAAWSCAALFPLAAPAQTSTTCHNTPAYSPCDLVFELSPQAAAANPDPYRTVELRAELRSPRHRTIEIPGFWDGGGRMVVRFAPTEGGQWDFHIISNVPELNDKTGTISAADSGSFGFIIARNVHHWAYTEHPHTQIAKGHLWMGAAAPQLVSMEDSAFRALVDARASQKFNHLTFPVVTAAAAGAAFSSPDSPKLDFFRRLDERVRYLNQKGIIADLTLAAGEGAWTKLFPEAAERRRFVRMMVARYAAMNVTWLATDFWEDYPDARALMKEVGGALKEFDGYHHPRSTGARMTSSPLLDDGWMDYVSYGAANDDMGSIEHQLYSVAFVNRALSGPDAASVRRGLWNSFMDGESPALAGNAPDDVKAMTVWFDLVSQTRYWELEPYFDVDGGRAVALPAAQIDQDESISATEYLVYLEKPGPLELRVEKHGYDALWINPADGTVVKRKFSGDHFTAAPPDSAHDWVLHLVREGALESMNRSYKFESRDILMQDIEANPDKTPYDVDQPAGDLTIEKPAPYSVKLKRESRATRSMRYLWTGEVTADHQGFRVLGTGAQGTMTPSKRLAANYPALLLMKVYGMNANGKVYLVTKAAGLNQ